MSHRREGLRMPPRRVAAVRRFADHFPIYLFVRVAGRVRRIQCSAARFRSGLPGRLDGHSATATEEPLEVSRFECPASAAENLVLAGHVLQHFGLK